VAWASELRKYTAGTSLSEIGDGSQRVGHQITSGLEVTKKTHRSIVVCVKRESDGSRQPL
jgi:hypothetical protein